MIKADVARDVVPPPQAPRLIGGRYRRLALLLAALLGVPLGLVLLAMIVIVALALTSTSIDASRWRDAVAERASGALGRTVILQGALELEPTLSRELGLRIGVLRLPSPAGFTAQDVLTIGELHARIDLFEALQGRLQSSRIEARAVDLQLERRLDGTGNWTTSSPREASGPLPAIDIAAVVLHRLDIRYDDARSATRRAVTLDQLSGSAGQDRRVRLAARWRPEAPLEFALAFDGGPLRLLRDAAGSWPFTVDVNAPGMRMRANGTVDARQGSAQVNIDARAEGTAPIAALTGVSMPDLGSLSLRCAVELTPDAARVSDLHGRLGESEFSGQLALALGGARPRVDGFLRAATLDVRPFLAASSQAEPPSSRTRAPMPEPLSLRDLAAVDAEVDLKVERWLGLSVDVRDLSLAWRSDEGGVQVPINATIAGARFAGALELDATTPTPALTFALRGDNVALAELARGLGVSSGIEGTVRRVRLHAKGQGDTAASLAGGVEAALRLAGGQLRFGAPARGDPILVAVDALELAVRRGTGVTGHARGSVLGQRATLGVRGGTVPDALREGVMPLALDLALDDARLRVDGELAFNAPQRDTAVRFDFHARRAGDLAGLLGVAPQAALPVALRGQVRVSDTAWSLHDGALELGRSRVKVSIRHVPGANHTRTVAQVRGPLIDAQELLTLRAARPSGRSASPNAGPSAAIDLGDADVDVRLDRIRLGEIDLENVAFAVSTRRGGLSPVQIAGMFAGAPFTALVEMDARTSPPSASAALAAEAIDVGGLLRGLGIADDIDGHVQALNLTVQGRGDSLTEWITRSGFDVRVSGGDLAVRGAAQSTIAEIRVDEARIGAPEGEPLRAFLRGEIRDTPLSIRVGSGTLAALASDTTRVPFELAAQAGGTHFALDGEVSLPLGSGGRLNLSMHGDRLDSLSRLARVELPAWGPWSFGSPIHMTPSGYSLPRLQARVGGSRFSGAAALDVSRLRPAFDLQVSTPSIQLDDFPLPERLTDPPARPDEGRDLRQTASRVAGHTDRLLSAAFLRRFDASIDVTAKEVLSGSDRLADGAVHLKLEDGQLHLRPAVLNVPGGTVRLSMSYQATESEIELGVAANVEQFDYGVIARRFDRTANLRGLFSLDLALFGKAPSLEAITRNANGRIDFAVWPTELSSGAFKLWSVNLLLELLPLVDPDTRPQVNCIVGRFDLEHGDLRDDVMLIDTSAVRIRGSGHANLATEELEFVFRPRAKGFALFRLQTPLRVSGTIGDQQFGFRRFDLVESTLRLVASPVLVPIELFTLGPMPRDGADVCTNPLRSGTR